MDGIPIGNPVHDAARQNNVQLLMSLLDEGVPYTEPNECKYTALHVAAKEGSVECVNALLNAAWKSGIYSEKALSKLCQHGDDGETPLTLSIKGGHWQVLEILLDSYSTRTYVAQALHAACVENETKCVVILASRFPEHVNHGILCGGELCYNNNSEDYEPFSATYPLHTVIEHENLEAVESLLDAGADVNILGGELDMPALHFAIQKGDERIVRAILEKNCDFTIEDKYGNMALHVATDFSNEAIIRLILDKIKAIYRTPEEIVGNCCPRNVYHQTPLSIAVEKGMWEIFHIFSDLYTSSTISASDEVLHIACRKKSIQGIKIILDKFPGLIDQADNDGYFPVHTCARHGNMEMLDCLIEAGGNLDARNHITGCALFHSAAANKSSAILEFLLKRSNFGINEFGLDDTPLHVAALKGNLASVKILLKHGADASIVKKGKWCPLVSAMCEGFFDVVNILSDVTPKKYGTDIILQAARHREDDLLQLLLEKDFSVQCYSSFWINFLELNAYDLPSKIELLVVHGVKFDGLETLFEACCTGNVQRFDISFTSFNVLVKYGILETMHDSKSSLSDKLFINNCFPDIATSSLVTNKMKLCLQRLPYIKLSGSFIQCSVPNLKNLCRWTIRRALALQHHAVAPKNVNRLSLPLPLKKFLMHEKLIKGKRRFMAVDKSCENKKAKKPVS